MNDEGGQVIRKVVSGVIAIVFYLALTYLMGWFVTWIAWEFYYDDLVKQTIREQVHPAAIK